MCSEMVGQASSMKAMFNPSHYTMYTFICNDMMYLGPSK